MDVLGGKHVQLRCRSMKRSPCWRWGCQLWWWWISWCWWNSIFRTWNNCNRGPSYRRRRFPQGTETSWIKVRWKAWLFNLVWHRSCGSAQHKPLVAWTTRAPMGLRVWVLFLVKSTQMIISSRTWTASGFSFLFNFLSLLSPISKTQNLTILFHQSCDRGDIFMKVLRWIFYLDTSSICSSP